MTNATILIVDDDEEDKELFTEAVSHIDKNIICYTASTTVEALDFLVKLKKTKLPNYIFLDLNMPGIINSYDCLEKIKTDEDFSDIPVIMFTGSSQDIDMQKSKELGASFFLTKPSKFNTLVNVLASIIIIS